MKKTIQKYKLYQLNKIADSSNRFVTVIYDNTRYTLENFTKLNLGEDGFDEDEKTWGYSGINAYVEEIPERLPLEDITDIYVSEKIKVV